MTIAFLADLHFCSKNNHLPTFTSQMLFYENQFFPYLLENNIKDVLNLGDSFDNRQSVGIYILQELRERFFGWFAKNDVKLHILSGNHDIVYNTTREWNVYKATGIDLIKNIHVYNEPTKLVIGNLTFGMIPWICDGVLDLPKGCDILAGHFETVGFPVTKGIDSKHGHSIKEFEKYKMVLSGHFHIHSQQGNLTYLGNPYQKDYGCLNLTKGFFTLDEQFNLTQHENIVSPRHINFVYDETETGFEVRSYGLGKNDVTTNDMKKIDIITDLCHSNYTKLIVNSGSNDKQISKIYSAMVEASGEGFTPQLINTTQIVSNVDKDKMEKEILQDGDVIGNMRLYTDSVTLKDDIDKVLLVEMFEDIYKTTVIGAM